MTGVGLVLLRAGGWARGALVAGSTAVVSGLLLVVVAILRLPARPEEALFSLVADTGTRYGTVVAVALLTVPPLLLLYQAVRLGSAARERRLAALRIAGATPGEVRWLGAVEVGVPSLCGGVGGIAVYALLRRVLGGSELWSLPSGAPRLVPTSVAPTGWQVALVVLGVVVAGCAVGGSATRVVTVSPLALTRHHARRPPRPWGAVLLAVAALPAAAAFLPGVGGLGSQLAASASVCCAVLGTVSLASWAAYRVARVAEGRASSVAVLLAARRLVTDPRSAGRAGAAVGGIGLVSGGSAGVLGDVLARTPEAFYLVSLGLVAAGLLAALAVVVASLAVHSAESLLDHRRSASSLAALGVDVAELGRAQRWEALLAAMPVACLGVLLGSAVLTPLADLTATGLAVVAGNLVVTPVLVALAIEAATRLTRPVVRRAASPVNLRTE